MGNKFFKFVVFGIFLAALNVSPVIANEDNLDSSASIQSNSDYRAMQMMRMYEANAARQGALAQASNALFNGASFVSPMQGAMYNPRRRNVSGQIQRLSAAYSISMSGGKRPHRSP